MSNGLNPARELNRLIAEGHISQDALQAITNISSDKLHSFLNKTQPGMVELAEGVTAPSDSESAHLSILAAHLTEGLRIDDDERLKAIFQSLTIECLLTPHNIAQLTGLNVGDIEYAVRDPRFVPIDRKYELAIKGSYLINAINQARG